MLRRGELVVQRKGDRTSLQIDLGTLSTFLDNDAGVIRPRRRGSRSVEDLPTRTSEVLWETAFKKIDTKQANHDDEGF